MSAVPTRFEVLVHDVMLATRARFGTSATAAHVAGIMLTTAIAVTLADPEWARSVLAEAKDPGAEGPTPDDTGRAYIEITNRQLREWRDRSDTIGA